MFELLELILGGATWIILLVALVFVIGIVWRVEAELDTAYKYLSFAVVFYLLNEILVVLPVIRELVLGDVFIALVRFLSALMLFLGMYFMRDLIRRMDGEKKP